MGFKDKDVKTAEAIFKEQEAKPDHVDYEFNTWKGKFFFLVMATSRNLMQPSIHRDSSRLRCAAKS